MYLTQSGQPVEVVSQSSGLAVTSWANVASQPPKKVIPKKTVNNGTTSQVLCVLDANPTVHLDLAKVLSN